jgi:hypothetical protein
MKKIIALLALSSVALDCQACDAWRAPDDRHTHQRWEFIRGHDAFPDAVYNAETSVYCSVSGIPPYGKYCTVLAPDSLVTAALQHGTAMDRM